MKYFFKYFKHTVFFTVTAIMLISCIGIVYEPLNTLSGSVSIQYINSTYSVPIGTELNAIYTGSESVYYQWRLDGSAISGATSSRYIARQPGRYTVAVRASGYNTKVSSDSITVYDPNPAPAPAPRPPSGSVTSVTISPSNPQVNLGGSVQLSARVSGSSNTRVTWQVSSSSDMRGTVTSGTSININGLLTVSPNERASTLFVRAISAADTSKYGATSVAVRRSQPTVTPQPAPVSIAVNVTPKNQSVEAGGALQLSASVTGTTNTRVTWRVSSSSDMRGAVASGTNVNASGRLTVSANERASTLYVSAVSAADTSKSDVVSVRVTQKPSAAPTPPSQGNQGSQGNERPGQGNQNNQRPGQGNQGDRNNQGDRGNQGSQRPGNNQPATPTPAISVSISPANPTVAVGSPLQLTAAVTGTTNTRVTWRVGSSPSGGGAVGNGTSINNNGRLTVSANERASTLYVTATSAADPSKSAVIAVTVVPKN